MNPIVMTMARRLAAEAIKRELRAKGEKITYLPSAVISTAARTYLEEHPELIEQAELSVLATPVLRKLYRNHEAKSEKGALKHRRF